MQELVSVVIWRDSLQSRQQDEWKQFMTTVSGDAQLCYSLVIL